MTIMKKAFLALSCRTLSFYAKISWSLTLITFLISLTIYVGGYSYVSILEAYFEGGLKGGVGSSEFGLSVFVRVVLPIYFLPLSILLSLNDLVAYKRDRQADTISSNEVAIDIKIPLEKSLEKSIEETSTDTADSKVMDKKYDDLEDARLRLEELIKNKFYKEHDLRAKDIAKMLFIPKYRLSGVIKSLGFKSISELLNHYRIEEACQLIQTQSDMTIKEIYFEIGYSNAKSFNTTFQRFKGCMPSEFKENND